MRMGRLLLLMDSTRGRKRVHMKTLNLPRSDDPGGRGETSKRGGLSIDICYLQLEKICSILSVLSH